jgi:microcystin degradation protein MlrC
MRVFLGGIVTETNTFSPIPTGLDDFETIRRLEDVREGSELAAIRDRCAARGFELVFGLSAFAQPAGRTVRSAYEALRSELLERLAEALPVDLVLLPLHGAMAAEGEDDCEGDLIERVRALVGPDVVVGVELDLHCHLTERMVRDADAIVIYQEYPHIDMATRAEELFDLCVATLQGRVRPVMAMVDCRTIGLFPTTREPLRSFVDAMRQAEGRGGVLSLSLGHGFPWGDVADCGARMLAVVDGDPALAERTARAWARRFYEERAAISLRPLDLTEAIDRALASTPPGSEGGPVVLADQSDNPGGGAPGDSTFVLRALLERGIEDAALGMIWDPIVVSLAHAAGPGARLRVRLGGKMGPASGDPLDLEVTVTGLARGLMQRWPQKEGAVESPCGDAAALRVGGIDVVVASRRTQVFSPEVFTRLGVDAASRRLVVVKSSQHFYAGFAPIAREILYVAAPGAVPVRIRDIPYEHADTAQYPFVEEPPGAP